MALPLCLRRQLIHNELRSPLEPHPHLLSFRRLLLSLQQSPQRTPQRVTFIDSYVASKIDAHPSESITGLEFLKARQIRLTLPGTDLCPK